jgi:hypothetical protein
VPARDWLEAVAVFDTFEQAARFTTALSVDGVIRHRIASALEPPMAQTLTPLKPLFGEDQAAVLLILDAAQEWDCRDLVAQHGGAFHFWKRPEDAQKCPLAYMVYGHRMLWIKKQVPQSAFLHCYGSTETVFDQMRAIKDRFGSDVWLELKYMRSGWFRRLRGLSAEGMQPSVFITMMSGERAFMDRLMAFCDSIGVTYQNPHTFALEETGLFSDFDRIVAFKRQTDPQNLLNPGKIGTRFFDRPR